MASTILCTSKFPVRHYLKGFLLNTSTLLNYTGQRFHFRLQGYIDSVAMRCWGTLVPLPHVTTRIEQPQSVFVTQALPWINPQTFEKSSRFPFKVAKLEGCELSAKSSHDTQQCQSTVLSQHRGESRGKTNREVERARWLWKGTWFQPTWGSSVLWG